MANERRVRAINCFGSLAQLLTQSGTTVYFNSAPLALPTIDSTKHAALVIDPDSASEEVVYVTAYTAGATQATVLRPAPSRRARPSPTRPRSWPTRRPGTGD
jgi:hypothetical protein